MALSVYGLFLTLFNLSWHDSPTDWYFSRCLETITNIFGDLGQSLNSSCAPRIRTTSIVLLVLFAFLLLQPPVLVGSSPFCIVKPPFSHSRWQWERSSYIFHILQVPILGTNFGWIISLNNNVCPFFGINPRPSQGSQKTRTVAAPLVAPPTVRRAFRGWARDAFSQGGSRECRIC